MKVEATFRGTIKIEPLDTDEPVNAADAMEAVLDTVTEALMGADEFSDQSVSGSLATGEFEVVVTLDLP